jgi:hypothetical protein
VTTRTSPRHRVKIDAHVRAAALLGILASVFATVRYGTREGISVALGAIIAVGNLLVIAWMLRDFGEEPEEGQSRGGSLRALLLLKPIGLLGLALLILRQPFVSGIAFVAGVAVLPLGIVLGETQKKRA